MSKKRSLIFFASMLSLCGAVLHGEETEVAAAPSPQVVQPGPSTQAREGHIEWLTSYSDAVSRAKAENKSIILFFTGSDWCGWCKKMENEILSTPEFAQAAGNKFIFVMVDFPMNKTLPPVIADQNAALKQKFGITGYPTVIVLDCDEKFVAETGYRSGGGKAYADYLLGLKS